MCASVPCRHQVSGKHSATSQHCIQQLLLRLFHLKSRFCYSTYTFLTYVNGWQIETGKFVAFVPHFTIGRCIDRGPKRAQIFDLFRSSKTPGSLLFLQNLLNMEATKPFRDSGAATLLLQEFVNTTTLDHLGSVLQVYIDFTVGVRGNYTGIQATYGCAMPKSETSQFVYPPVSKLENLNPAGLNVTSIENEDPAIFCGHLGISLNCIGFDYETCLSNILLPMQTDGLLPFRSTQRWDQVHSCFWASIYLTRVCEVKLLHVCCHWLFIWILNDSLFCSRLRYSSFTSWCAWHIPEQQNISGLDQPRKLHACNTCRQAARMCSAFPNRVIAAEISLNCSTEHSNLNANAEFSLVCDDASDTTACSVWNWRCCSSVGFFFSMRYSATVLRIHHLTSVLL